MKRLALLSVVSLMLASTVFAPVAVAQELGEVDVQSVRLGPGGSVTVTGTIQCVEEQQYDAYVRVRQKTGGNIILRADVGESGICPTTGLKTFTGTAFGQTGQEYIEKPFHKGRATVTTFGRLCAPDYSCTPNQESTEVVYIR